MAKGAVWIYLSLLIESVMVLSSALMKPAFTTIPSFLSLYYDSQAQKSVTFWSYYTFNCPIETPIVDIIRFNSGTCFILMALALAIVCSFLFILITFFLLNYKIALFSACLSVFCSLISISCILSMPFFEYQNIQLGSFLWIASFIFKFIYIIKFIFFINAESLHYNYHERQSGRDKY